MPEPPHGDLPCPLEVERNPRAAAYWGMYLLSTAPGHLAPLDAPLLARLCLALAYADEATAQVRALGLLVKAPNTGLPIQSPWVAIMNRQTEIARKLAPSGGCRRRSAAAPPWRRGRQRRLPGSTSGASDAAGDGARRAWKPSSRRTSGVGCSAGQHQAQRHPVAEVSALPAPVLTT